MCVESAGIADDILVLAGDNMVDFSFAGFVKFFKEKGKSCIMTHREESIEKLQRTGVALLSDDGRLVEMQEKPQEPKSHFAGLSIYIYAKEDLELLMQGIAQGKCGVDSPGSLTKWFCTERDVYAYEMPGKRYDIGNQEVYERMK